MNTTPAIIAAAVVLAIVGLLSWRFGPSRLPRYVVGVAMAWAIVLSIAWVTGGPARLEIYALVCAGFALGMLALYIKLRIVGPDSLNGQ